MSISTANEIAKLPPEKPQQIISEKPKITHKEVKEMQKEESVSADEDVEIPDDDEDEDDTNEEETDGYTAVTLTVTEAETLSRYMDALLVRVMGDDYDVLRSLADRLTQ